MTSFAGLSCHSCLESIPLAPAGIETHLGDMDWSFLAFLGEPWFVICWYAIGLLGAWYVVYDARNHNTVLKPAMQWAWPVIVVFFSVIGIALYLLTARAPGIDKLQEQDAKKGAHDEFERSMWRRVNGASSHCVAGDGLGIMTGMVIARAASMSFWQEFWFEYAVGFVIGWFVFQRKSMQMMTNNLTKQLAMAGRAEFFSMLTVMGGMGAVMTFVTPYVATSQPKPLTAAFWGFGALGLLVGYILTFPMNWMLVAVGWKHGMGSKEGASTVEKRPAKLALIGTMVVLGVAALVLPAWLTVIREHRPLRSPEGAMPTPDLRVGQALSSGLQTALKSAQEGLAGGERSRAAESMDAAFRLAEVGAYSAPGSFYSALEQIRSARIALQQGQVEQARKRLGNAAQVVRPGTETTPPFLDVKKYEGARVLDSGGAVVGQVITVGNGSLEIALGGWQRAWGLFTFGTEREVRQPADAIAYGPPRAVGMKMVMVPGHAARVASH